METFGVFKGESGGLIVSIPTLEDICLNPEISGEKGGFKVADIRHVFIGMTERIKYLNILFPTEYKSDYQEYQTLKGMRDKIAHVDEKRILVDLRKEFNFEYMRFDFSYNLASDNPYDLTYLKRMYRIKEQIKNYVEGGYGEAVPELETLDFDPKTVDFLKKEWEAEVEKMVNEFISKPYDYETRETVNDILKGIIRREIENEH